MSLAHLYEDLSALLVKPPSAEGADDDAVQDAQLSGFEAGYEAGWEDAVVATTDEQKKLAAELVQTIQDLSFTHHEAFTKLSAGMQPLMAEMVTAVLPEVARDGLHRQLVDQIEKLVSPYADNTIALVVAPQSREAVETALEEQTGLPFTIAEDPLLTPGQAFLRVNQEEREVDTDAVLAEIRDAVEAFFQSTPEALKYG